MIKELDNINPWCKNADGSLCQSIGVPYACDDNCLRKMNYMRMEGKQMQCKDCTHQIVCQFKSEFNRLEGQLPVTQIPFRATVTCDYYEKELPRPRGVYDQFNVKELTAKG